MRSRLAIYSSLIAFCLAVGSAVITSDALHAPRSIPVAEAADALARRTGSSWSDLKVRAPDGVVLDGWLFTPHHPNGSAVIAIHGVADSRMGMLAHADFLLRGGFTVLVPDCRGHGLSGGDIITYGVRESTDVRCWTNRLLQDRTVRRLYGIGQSMGGAILLQSLKIEPRFRAIVADCSFATFQEIAFERLHQVSGIPQFAFWPMVHLGFLYAEVVDRVDLRQASPLDAIRGTHTPILLIHGASDTNIPPRHSRELHEANPGATALWIVPGAGHVASLGTQPETYARKVVDWFRKNGD